MGFLCIERHQQSTFLVSQPSQFIILMYLSNINKTHCIALMLQPFFLLPTMLRLWLVGQLPSMNACSSVNFK